MRPAAVSSDEPVRADSDEGGPQGGEPPPTKDDGSRSVSLLMLGSRRFRVLQGRWRRWTRMGSLLSPFRSEFR